MASSPHSLLPLFLAILIPASNAQNGLILPIRNDAKTSQFYTTMELGSNRATINTVIDLGAQTSWIVCDNYTSSTYSPIPCDAKKCESLREHFGCVGCNEPPRPGCSNDTCGAMSFNPFLDTIVPQGFAEDTLFAKNQQPISEYIFSCMGSAYMQGLARDTNGIVGLARNQISFHKQVTNRLKLPDKFSLCFPSSGLGKLWIGGDPSTKTLSGISRSIMSTPLIINPVSTAPIFTEGDASDEYFIGVESIRVAGKPLTSIKSSYFSIDKKGVGGTKISTINNYTAVHNNIYMPLTRTFTKAASDMKIKSAAAVSPFRACFRSDSISRAPSGPSVPTIDLVLPGSDVYWRINGANAMVEVDRKTTCLAIVDGGSSPRTSIVIGAHQLQENFLEFDLVSSVVKFSSSLLIQNKSCSNL